MTYPRRSKGNSVTLTMIVRKVLVWCFGASENSSLCWTLFPPALIAASGAAEVLAYHLPIVLLGIFWFHCRRSSDFALVIWWVKKESWPVSTKVLQLPSRFSSGPGHIRERLKVFRDPLNSIHASSLSSTSQASIALQDGCLQWACPSTNFLLFRNFIIDNIVFWFSIDLGTLLFCVIIVISKSFCCC